MPERQDIRICGGLTEIPLFRLTLSEFRAHSLALERQAEARYGEYAMRMHYLDARRVADAFEMLKMVQRQEVKTLEAEAEGRGRSWLSPWEYLWRMTHSSHVLEPPLPASPHSARQALEFVIAMEKRARAYYGDVATRARDAHVRACATEMSDQKNRRLELLEQLLALEVGASWKRVASLGHDGRRVA